MDIGKIVDFFYSRFFWRVCVLLPLFIAVITYLRGVYRDKFTPSEELPYYDVQPRAEEDTLRVIIVGDSWAEFHTNLSGDTILERAARRISRPPVRSWTRGKGGALTKEIYHYMFESLEHEYEEYADRCTQELIESAPDYCVLFAGINDAIFQRSLEYYQENMRLMIRMLLHHGIRPVVMQIPMVDAAWAIDYKPYLHRTAHHLKARLVGTRQNTIPKYREALTEMLASTRLKDSVLYIPADRWDKKGGWDESKYISDRVHLNMHGYHVLDSCIAAEILSDWTKRHASRRKASGPGKD